MQLSERGRPLDLTPDASLSVEGQAQPAHHAITSIAMMGNGHFTDVTEQSGLRTPDMYSVAVTWQRT